MPGGIDAGAAARVLDAMKTQASHEVPDTSSYALRHSLCPPSFFIGNRWRPQSGWLACAARHLVDPRTLFGLAAML